MSWLSHFWRSLTRGTRVLLVLWVGGSLAGFLARATIALSPFPALALDSSAVTGFQPWRLITYALVTNDPLNAILGALFLVFLGGAVERVWNLGFFLGYYLGCTIASGLAIYFLASAAMPTFTHAGALLGLLVAWHALNRSQRFQLFGGPEISATASAAITALCILLPALAVGWRFVLALVCGASAGWIGLRIHGALGGQRANRAADRPRMRRLEL